MNRFHSAKIYRLVCDTGKEYIGSTICSLDKRLREHKCLSNDTTSKYLINPRMELIKNFPCENRKELEHEETKYIKASNNCINTKIPHRTKQEYHNDNREKIYEQRKQYRLEHKQRLKEEKKQYYLKNKDKINEKKNEKFNCECGGKYTHTSKSQHIKTKKHQDFLKGLSSEPLS